MFSTPETSVHVRDKNREISPLGREEGYGGKGSGEKVSFKTRMEDPVRQANHHFQGQKSIVNLQGAGHIVAASHTDCLLYDL